MYPYRSSPATLDHRPFDPFYPSSASTLIGSSSTSYPPSTLSRMASLGSTSSSVAQRTSTWQDKLTDHCAARRIPAPSYNVLSDRRGKRTAWSCTVNVSGQTVPAKYWYDGQYVNTAKEDAAEAALQKLQGKSSSGGGNSAQQGRLVGWARFTTIDDGYNLLINATTELIIHIFQSADDFATAAASSHTSAKFNSTYKANLTSICGAILPRTIQYFDQARELREVQEKGGDGGWSSLERVQSCFKNEDTAYLALCHYRTSIMKCDNSFHQGELVSRGIEHTERTYILQVQYRVTTLATLAKEQLSYSKLASLDMLSFKQMKEMLCWVTYWCPDGKKISLGIAFEDSLHDRGLQIPGVATTQQDWRKVMDFTNCLIRDLDTINKGLHSVRYRMFHQGRFFYFFMLHDLYKKIEELGRDVSLAELLPLLPKRETEVDGYDLSVMQ